ncbi:hypothetical protein M3J09_002141 [Ascochyta lentis]
MYKASVPCFTDRYGSRTQQPGAVTALLRFINVR